MSTFRANWIPEALEGGLTRLAEASHRRPLTALLAVGLLSVLGLLAASQLSLDADFKGLLPKSFPSVQDLELLEERTGGVGYACVVGYGADAAALQQFAELAAPILAALPSVSYVDYKRPVDFLRDRAGYYLETAQLAELEGTIKARYDWEKRRRNPMYLNFEDPEPPPLELPALASAVGQNTASAWLARHLTEVYYLDPQAQLINLNVKPNVSASDLAECRRVMAEIREAISRLDLAAISPDLKVGYAGRFAKRVEAQDQIVWSLTYTSLLAGVLMLGFLWINFRRVSAIGLVLGPLLVGLAWTFGFAGLAFGTLNILTAFVGTELLGMGFAHGIQLLTRYSGERSRGRGLTAAIQTTFGNTGRAVTVAGLTTVVGFAGLGISRFRAFSELGILAAVGMTFVMISWAVTLPALLALAERLGWQPPPVPEPTSGPRWWRSWAPGLAIASVGVLLLALSFFPAIRFNYDMSALEDGSLPTFQMDARVNKLLGYDQNPAAIPTDDPEQERQVATMLREQQDRLGPARTIDFVATLADLVPADQQAKYASLQRIGKILARIDPDALPAEMRERFAQVERLTRTPPFTRADVPPDITRQFIGPNATLDQGFVLLFPNFRIQDGDAVRRFAKQVRELRLPDGRRLAAAGEPMLLADVIEMVVSEGPVVLSLAMVLIFLCLWVLLGHLRQALACLLPAVATLIGTLGFFPILGWELNYVNIVMIPVLFGLSVDGGAHLTVRLAAGEPLGLVLHETGRGVAGALLMTGLGFGSLVLATHPGVRSFGETALLGIAMNLLACLVFLPAVLILLEKRLGFLQKSQSAGGAS